MNYYSIDDNSQELMHHGIKGMKWGVIRTDAQLGHPINPRNTKRLVRNFDRKSRSPAYISASSKLRKMMKSGIEKAQSDWNTYNSPENKAIRQQKRDVNKAVRAYKRNERLFEKHVQLARQGRLKYKGISDSEVQRITDRLALERNARNLSGAERQSIIRRLTSSVGEGIVSGVGQGVSYRVTEKFSRGGKLKTAKKMAEQNNRIAQDKAREDFKREMHEQKVRDKYKENHDLDVEYRQTMAEEGHPFARKRLIRNATKQKRLYDVKTQRDTEDFKRRMQEAYEKSRNEQIGKNSVNRYDSSDWVKSHTLTPGGTGALQRLNEWNSDVEDRNRQLSNAYDRQRAYEKAYVTRQQRERDSIARTAAAKHVQQMRNEREKAQQARIAEEKEFNSARLHNDYKNTSKKRKKNRKRAR